MKIISTNTETYYKAKVEECKELETEIKRIRELNHGYQTRNIELSKQLAELETEKNTHEEALKKLLSSNLTSIPWLAGMMADYLTYDFEVLAKKLDWGANQQREKKVASIREIRAEASRRIEEAKTAIYQLEYLKTLFPAIEDVLQAEYSELEFMGDIPDYDPVRKYLEKDEWESLSTTKKNQLALDRYIESRKKSNWQIGRDYELSVAYEYKNKGYSVDTFGSYMGLEDMGRDIIASNINTTLIIQCKYWSHEKMIHEKHIFQLYGSMVSYGIENSQIGHEIKGVFVTNISLSPKAKEVASYLQITVIENRPMIDFPRIKCNIGRGEWGIEEKIYHLPMDEQYDSTKIDKPGEFFAFTVQEAEQMGFRRAYKHYAK